MFDGFMSIWGYQFARVYNDKEHGSIQRLKHICCWTFSDNNHQWQDSVLDFFPTESPKNFESHSRQ